jgi:hypothetical protein
MVETASTLRALVETRREQINSVVARSFLSEQAGSVELI